MATTTSMQNKIRPLLYDEASFAWDAIVPALDDEHVRALDGNLKAAVAEGQSAREAIAEAMTEVVRFAFEGDGDERWREAARECWERIFAGSWRPPAAPVDPLAENAQGHRSWVAQHEMPERQGSVASPTVQLKSPIIENTYNPEDGSGVLRLGSGGA
jgi:hypothetical protein